MLCICNILRHYSQLETEDTRTYLTRIDNIGKFITDYITNMSPYIN